MRRISKALGLLLLLALSAASGRRMPSDADLPWPPASSDSYPAPADDFIPPFDEPTADPDDWVLPADDDPLPPFEPTPDEDPADFYVPDTPAYPDAPAEDVMPDAPADEPVPVGGVIKDISATLHWYTPMALSYSSTKWGIDSKGNQKGHWDQQPGEVAAGSQGAVSGYVKSTTKTTDIEFDLFMSVHTPWPSSLLAKVHVFVGDWALQKNHCDCTLEGSGISGNDPTDGFKKHVTCKVSNCDGYDVDPHIEIKLVKG